DYLANIALVVQEAIALQQLTRAGRQGDPVGGADGPVTRLGPELRERYRREGIIGSSPAIDHALCLVERAALSRIPVHLEGETGTGKELCARLIHDHGPRARGPFLAQNCAALTESVLESELFGHARGAFTGADRDHKGLVEAAAGGTLFLDEIGET